MTSGYTSLPLENFLSCVLAPVGGGVVHVIGYFLLPSPFCFSCFSSSSRIRLHMSYMLWYENTHLYSIISHIYWLSLCTFLLVSSSYPPAFLTFLLLVPPQLSTRHFSNTDPLTSLRFPTQHTIIICKRFLIPLHPSH